MSLLNDFARPCVLLNRTVEEDGEGGYITSWSEGVRFDNYQAVESSVEARVAEKQGVTSIYNALVNRELPIGFHDVFKDVYTGNTYRVTSHPDDKKAPKSASFELKFFTAERWELPKQ